MALTVPVRDALRTENLNMALALGHGQKLDIEAKIAFEKQKAASARSSSEPAAPSGAFSVAGGSLPVSSAEVLGMADDHAERAAHLKTILLAAGTEYTARFLAKVTRQQATHAYVCEVLRRHAACMTVRQPEENRQ